RRSEWGARTRLDSRRTGPDRRSDDGDHDDSRVRRRDRRRLRGGERGTRHRRGNLPDGLISHAAGPTDEGGLLLVDVWESEEALDRFFKEHAGPAMEKVSVSPSSDPQVHQVHNHIPQGGGVHPNVLVLIETEGFGPDDYDAVTGQMDAHAGDDADHPAVAHIAAVRDD